MGKKKHKFTLSYWWAVIGMPKAETQRERSEKQTTAQAPGKRNRIDFSAPGEREHLQPKKSRLQIYNIRGSLPYARDRQRTRLG